MTANEATAQDAGTELANVAGFPVISDSPFADGYDIAAERDALADLVASEHPDPADPRWARFLELRKREADLRGRRQPAPAPSAVPPIAIPAARLGQLEDTTPDTMTLHTKDAYGLFSGRQADNPAGLPPIPGGRRFAAVLKSIWHLSANDNPYADWILIRMYDALVGVRANLARVIAAREEGMDVLKRKGLSISVMASRSPKSVELGFRSPYTRFDCRVSGAEAQKIVKLLEPDVADEKPVLIGFKIADIYPELFTFEKGDKKGQAGVSIKGRLLRIKFAKVNGEPVDLPQPARSSESERVAA